jgi:hypothetical protein
MLLALKIEKNLRNLGDNDKESLMIIHLLEKTKVVILMRNTSWPQK